jgi:Zn2+/Cd2+-exporting ATPase
MTQTPSLKTQQMQVGGMDCGSCAKTIEVSLLSLRGVTEASVSFATEKVKVSYDAEEVTEKAIFDRIKGLGYTVNLIPQTISLPGEKLLKLQAKIGGMDCGGCAKTVETGLQQLPGITDVTVVFATETLRLVYDRLAVSETVIFDRIKSLGYTVELHHGQHSQHSHHHTDSCSHEHQPKKTSTTNFTDWKFWIHNRRGQSVILAGVGLLLGLVTQQLGLPIWICDRTSGFNGIAFASRRYEPVDDDFGNWCGDFG